MFVDGTIECFMKSEWIKWKGMDDAFSKRQQIVLKIIDARRRNQSRREYANHLDWLRDTRKSTVSKMWDNWRKTGGNLLRHSSTTIILVGDGKLGVTQQRKKRKKWYSVLMESSWLESQWNWSRMM